MGTFSGNERKIQVKCLVAIAKSNIVSGFEDVNNMTSHLHQKPLYVNKNGGLRSRRAEKSARNEQKTAFLFIRETELDMYLLPSKRVRKGIFTGNFQIFPASSRNAKASGIVPRATGSPASPLSRMLCTRGICASSSTPRLPAIRAPPSRPKI